MACFLPCGKKKERRDDDDDDDDDDDVDNDDGRWTASSNRASVDNLMMSQFRNMGMRTAKGKGKHGASSSSSSAVEANNRNERIVEYANGVFLTLWPLGDNQNDIKRVRFSEEIFTKDKARKWWEKNQRKIMKDFNVPDDGRRGSTYSELPSVRESTEDAEKRMTYSRETEDEEDEDDEEDDEGEKFETIREVEDEMSGAILFIQWDANGTKTLRSIRLRNEIFGEVNPKEWWQENKKRIITQQGLAT